MVIGDSGIISGGQNGVLGDNGLEITEYFAHSFSVEDAMARGNLLCYEMNRTDLPPEHGGPVRLIAPGWYGVANVKWLDRIEVLDQRFAGRFMARDYVTARELEGPDGALRCTFTSVADDRLKSAPAKVLHDGSGSTIVGVAWGAPIDSVEISIDGGPWVSAELHGHRSHGRRDRNTSWRFWTHDGPTRVRASTRSPRVRSMPGVTSNPLPTIRSWPARPPSGRAMDTSPEPWCSDTVL